MSAINRIRITDEDISYAENILLKDGQTFDEERRKFIEETLTTLDLQAVPGSGKTTVLLAKLLIIERYLPFQNGQGILVLSHTNIAIEEIRERIEKYCPNLFSYPNFVGTIQSFVNNFLAGPFYISIYKKRPYRIDNEIYNERIERFFKMNIKGFSRQEAKNARYYLMSNTNLLCRYRLKNENGTYNLLKKLNGPQLKIIKPRRGKKWVDFTEKEKERIFEWLIKLKFNVMREGVLHYDDAYLLAEAYIRKTPSIKKILQDRFKYIFVDEMQDMGIHQYDLLEKIFYDDGNSTSIYQRIGDKNQSIYDGDVSLDEIWVNRETIININGSHRLTTLNAELVNCFTLNRDEGFNVTGLAAGNIKPHIIIYDDSTIKDVIPIYSSIVNDKIESGDIKLNIKNGYWVLGWVKNHLDQDKIGISDYSDEYSSVVSISKNDFSNLDGYLMFYDSSSMTLGPIRKNILNALIHILRSEDVIDISNNRPHSKSSLLLLLLREEHHDEYEFLKLKLFEWSIGLARDQFDSIYNNIKEYIPRFLLVFGKTINYSNDFIMLPSEETVGSSIIQSSNTVNYHGFDINIGTIHSVKGQTHTSTLYLETFHKKGQGNFESERLSDQFKFSVFDKNTLKIVKITLKMAYVGLSRPTDLLCIAIHKKRFNKSLSDIDSSKYIIVDITR